MVTHVTHKKQIQVKFLYEKRVYSRGKDMSTHWKYCTILPAIYLLIITYATAEFNQVRMAPHHNISQDNNTNYSLLRNTYLQNVNQTNELTNHQHSFVNVIILRNCFGILSERSVSVLPLQQTKQLDFSHCRFRGIDSGALCGPHPQFRTVFFRSNCIESNNVRIENALEGCTQTFDSVVIRKNHLCKSTHDFVSLNISVLRNARILLVNRQRILFPIHPPTLCNWTELHLIHCHIQAIPNMFLHNCYQLQSVNLAQNHIQTIDSTSFARLPNLSRLCLHSNKIEELQGSELAQCYNLSILNLGHNPLCTVNVEGVRKHLGAHLRVLDLRNRTPHSPVVCSNCTTLHFALPNTTILC